MARFILLTAVFFGATGVMLGAFGAHGLKSQLDTYGLDIFQKGVEYQFLHTLLLLALGLLALSKPGKQLQWSANFVIAGILLFSGSLYLLATKSLLGIDSMAGLLGPITPIGGSFLIISWILMGVHVAKNIKK
ncbi:MAG TPA: DUF423 domain-containing protein [Chitinophagales bacterium]|nr:DUF423 domain-containing protein [Chitinophagales bacterium]